MENNKVINKDFDDKLGTVILYVAQMNYPDCERDDVGLPIEYDEDVPGCADTINIPKDHVLYSLTKKVKVCVEHFCDTVEDEDGDLIADLVHAYTTFTFDDGKEFHFTSNMYDIGFKAARYVFESSMFVEDYNKSGEDGGLLETLDIIYELTTNADEVNRWIEEAISQFKKELIEGTITSYYFTQSGETNG